MKSTHFFMRSGVLIALLFASSAYAEAQEHSAHGGHTIGNGMNTMTVSPERLQSIGVKFEEAHRHAVNKTIRTVGRVETDERRLARVNIKLEGWIDQLYVNTTGQKVKKGQLLFTLYSPELVATQEEYLLAVRAAKTLGTSEFPEVAEGARSILEVSRRRLQLWDIADYHIRDLERTGKVLKTLPFHAPLSGTVIEKTAVAGMRVMPGDMLYTIADLSKIWVLADIYEYELPLIQTGQTAQVSLSYAPQTVFTGRIAFVYPTVDPETRTAKVRFELDNPKELLKPGMYANVELAVPLGERLAVSKDAVLESGERQIIFIHHGDGQLEWRNVKIGLRGGDWVEIVEGLQEGEHIVTSANFLLDSESQLKSAVGGMAGMKH
ncbi:efflux RND transporter periplasmic adaptor subunit [Candidatus Methylomicrobium oryzae]|uniref:efflux RND transporter periplasmic adaptor subunit n=1 Tax=Candidatus Methylomicrobium oryzae TaxID=2802053 RepID=UPI001F0272D3|nr:efflux RND transporter periplasmic adaptor subunit [Methylomicrobium sp. RS1]